MNNKPKDLSLVEIAEMIEPLIKKGCNTYQKFTCSLCSSRQTIAEPNVLYLDVKCELCGTITDLRETGCGVMVLGPPEVLLKDLLGK
jgi:hypothetical protein